MTALVRFALAGLGVFLVQWLVLDRLPIFGATPDLVLLFVAWMGLRFGRKGGLVAGFLLGFAMDVVHDTWGVGMLVKSLVGFLVSFFPTNERETLILQPQQAFLGGLLLALVHNGLLVAMKALGAGAAMLSYVTVDWLGAALYTAVVAFVATLFLNRS